MGEIVKEFFKLILWLIVMISISIPVNTGKEITRADQKQTSVMEIRPLLTKCVIQDEPEYCPAEVIDTAPPEVNLEKFSNPEPGGGGAGSDALVGHTATANNPSYGSPSGGLTKSRGVMQGPSGKETWYNLPMGGVIKIMRRQGFSEEEYPYWIRDDGAKMLGEYVMIAANLELRPRGTVIETSLGPGIVCDTGGFAKTDTTSIDIATNW